MSEVSGTGGNSSQDSEAVFRKLIARERCLGLLEVTSKMRIAETEGTRGMTRDALAECVTLR